MTLDQARHAWKSGQPNSDTLSERVAALRSRTATFESALLRRDWTETFAAVFVMIAFLPGTLSFPSLLARAGGALIILHAMFIVVVLWWTRKTQPDVSPTRPPAEYLTFRRQSVERQIRLLSAVPWWYVAPSFVGQLMIGTGLTSSLLEASPVLVICTLVCAGVVWLNLRAAWYQLPLLRDSIQTMIDDLQRDNGTPDATEPGAPATA
jgi:hypothetical protein